MTPGPGVHVLGHNYISDIPVFKVLYFFKIFLSTPGHRSYSNDNREMIYQNCLFHDPWGRGSCAKAWPHN